MVVARLLVERGSFREGSQDWGEYEFLALPSPGDRLTISRASSTDYLTVLCVHHKPRPADVADGGASAVGADVVAKWTGSE